MFRPVLLMIAALPLMLVACASDPDEQVQFIDFPGSERQERIAASEAEGWPNLNEVPERPAHAEPVVKEAAE